MTTNEMIAFLTKINNDEVCTQLIDKLRKLRELEDKATPKKPLRRVYKTYSMEVAMCNVCPCCEEPIVNVWSKINYKPPYCHCCSQALDWS